MVASSEVRVKKDWGLSSCYDVFCGLFQYDVRKASVVGLSKLFNRIYAELDASNNNLEAGYHTRTETSSHLEADDLGMSTIRPLETTDHAERTRSSLEEEELSVRTSGKSTKDEDLVSGGIYNPEETTVHGADDLMCDLSSKVDTVTAIVGKSDSDENMGDLKEAENRHALLGKYDSGDQQDVEDVEVENSLMDCDSNDGENLHRVEEIDAVVEECDLDETAETIIYDVPSEFEEVSGNSGFSTCNTTEGLWIEMLKAREQMIANAVLHRYHDQSRQER